MAELGIRDSVVGAKERFNAVSAIFRSIGRIFDITAAAEVAVELKHLEILRRIILFHLE